MAKYKILSLGILSLVLGVLWRLEVEYHGWEALKWIGYFHYAVPVGFLLFIAWANLISELERKPRIALNLIGLVFGAVMIYLIQVSLTVSPL
ncbi:MAG: hypothetical protein JKY52_07240 [Flavobacteriales bacterium]|nr:hypothetical protein [Flavobacteriales bacterium]